MTVRHERAAFKAEAAAWASIARPCWSTIRRYGASAPAPVTITSSRRTARASWVRSGWRPIESGSFIAGTA
jgi:hypothetical protein